MQITATIKAIFAAIVAGVVLVFAAMIRKSGADSVIAKQRKQDDELRKKFDQIDRESPDVDAALDRLRKRAGNGQPDAK